MPCSTKTLMLAVLALCLPLSVAHGQEMARKPLVIVRFNQANVYFENSMKMAVRKALEIKPDARFIIEQTLPGKPQYNTATDLARVVTVLRAQGVGDRMIRVTRRESEQSRTDEIQVFVE